jgi:hypothetical protein
VRARAGGEDAVVLPLSPFLRRWLPVAVALLGLWALGQLALLTTAGR